MDCYILKKKKKSFTFQGERKNLKYLFFFFIFLLFRWNWDPYMYHSIVCHHIVCCGQMNQEFRVTLLLIWQCSLTVQTQHMALTTSWHSGPAVDYRPANICLQLFNNFYGHLKSPEQLNRWQDGPPLGMNCGKLAKDFFMVLGCWYRDFWSIFNLLFRSDSQLSCLNRYSNGRLHWLKAFVHHM